MSIRRFPPQNRTPTHNLSGHDSEFESPPEYSLTDSYALGVAGTSQVATPIYIYYRIYAEDGAIPSKTPVTPSDPFLGRIKIRSVPPPRTIKAVKLCIAKMENIKLEDLGSTSVFLTSYSQSPMDDTEKLTILNGTGPGATPQEPLALLAKMSDSERSALESDGRVGLANAVERNTMPSEIRFVYYQLYADHSEIPSKVPIDPGEPSLGRIRADYVAPPHSPTSIKRCISRVEGNPALLHSDLFSDTSCDSPLTEGHISILRTDGPGLSSNEPMAIVQADVQVKKEKRSPPPLVTSIPDSDGKYLIKSRTADLYWNAFKDPAGINFVYFYHDASMELWAAPSFTQWDITHDTNGNMYIKMTSPLVPSLWVGAEIKGSAVPVPWRLIPADDKSFYLTTDMNHISNPRVPAAQEYNDSMFSPGSMATLKKGDQWQMWEFIRV